MTLPILAYGSTPKEAGTFTLYRALRPGLLDAGFDLRCVSLGAQQAALWDKSFADEGCVLLGAELRDLPSQARCFAQWCERNPVRFVMPLNSPAIRAALPHLPGGVCLLPRCADSVDFGYQRTLTCRERIATVVATTPRHVRDLTEHYRMAVEQITLIPHGISPAAYDALPGPSATRRNGAPLRLAFLGRLEHRQKGVLFLPDILARLEQNGVNYQLSVAGQGEHDLQLREGLNRQQLGHRVRFLGLLRPAEVAPFLSEHDALLFPSQHEGFGFVLIEALMAGCVPVASRLEGVTDFILRPGETGLLCSVGDTAQFAGAVAELARDPARLNQMETTARIEARSRFSDEVVTQAYAKLLTQWAEQAAPAFTPRPWTDFQLPHDLRDRVLRRWLRGVKRRVLGK